MSEFKGTPGPWWVDEDGWVAGGKGHPVCMFSLGIGDIEMSEREKKDGQLIAAAPEILDELIRMADDMDSLGYDVKSARAAIAKALGEQK
jgi:hypothetical protein